MRGIRGFTRTGSDALSRSKKKCSRLWCVLLPVILVAAAPAGPWTDAAASPPLPLDRALEAAALSRNDVTIRPDHTAVAGSFPLFQRWMTSPLDAPAEGRHLAEHLLSLAAEPPRWTAALTLLEGRDPLILQTPARPGRWSLPSSLSSGARKAVSMILDGVFAARAELRTAFQPLTLQEIEVMERRLLSDAMRPSTKDEPVYEPEALRETRRAIEAAERVDRRALARAGALLARAVWEAADLLYRDEAFLFRQDPLQFETALGRVRIGGTGPDVHQGPALLIVDPGGDDLYQGRVASAGPEDCSVVIDLKGNDAYIGQDRTQGVGVRGVGILLDLEGDDLYRAENVAQGAGVFGIGLLADMQGDDLYIADRFAQAASVWGYGGLLERQGDDLYRCASEGQAYTWLQGVACLMDVCGNDRYSAGTDRPDPREPDMNQSFAQGFAMGLRNLCPGGTALLADAAGNDVYQGRYFAQGASYWMGTGFLYDRAGHDTYVARRYAQGAGIHLSFGMLLDCTGDDNTISWGVSQGCGHDLGVGVLINEKGNDTYTADWLSLGGSEANGIGIFADNSGRDGYETRAGAGFGRLTPSRRSGGLGLFLDAEGRDRYSERGANDHMWFSNRWAVGIDEEAGGTSGLNLPPVQDHGLSCPCAAEQRRGEEASRLKKILLESKSLPLPHNVEALLSVAAHWGHERDIPEKARKELLNMDPEVSVPCLVRRLDTPDLLEWRVTTEVLTVHAFHALPLLEEQAAEGEAVTRRRALNALARLRDPRTLEVCLQGLKDPEPGIRAAAARAVGNIKEQGRLDRLVPLLQGLKRARQSGTTSPLIDHLLDKDAIAAALSVAVRSLPVKHRTYERFSRPEPAGDVAEELARFLLEHQETLEGVLTTWIETVRQPEGAASRLRPLLQDSAPSVRASAAYALGRLEDATALKSLLARLEDETSSVRDAAALALVFFQDRAVEPVLGVMDPEDVRLCIIGLDILGRIGTRRAFTAVSSRLDHPHEAVRTAAEHALGLKTP